MRRHLSISVLLVSAAITVSAQTAGRDQLARGKALWDQRLAKSAIAALEAAAKDPATAAQAHEQLGRIYTFKGWLQDNVFPGWHDEPSVRVKALDELRAAVAADPSLASARDALGLAEKLNASESVDPAPPRPEVRVLDQKIATATDVVAAVEERAKA